MRLILNIILALCLLLAPACAERAAPGDTADPDAPRLAVLSPGFAATLADLNYQDRIVARHAFDAHSPASIPVAGDQGGLDYETLVAARPTHIILEHSAQPLPDRLKEFAAQYDWEITQIPALTLADIRASITTLNSIADPASARSIEVTNLLARFDALSGVLSESELSREVLLVTWTDPVGVMGPGSFHYELAIHMGLEPLPASGGHYITLSVEDIIRLDPPTIVLLMPSESTTNPSSLLPLPARERLTACKNSRVYLMNDPAVLLGSTTLIKLADDLQAALGADQPVSN